MSFVLIQINPLEIITYLGDRIPDPIIWPDGSASHGVSAGGFIHGNWAVAPLVYTPASPGEFYTLASSTPSFDGKTVTFTQVWVAQDITAVQATLNSRIDGQAEDRRLKYITGGVGQGLIYLQKYAEAMAILSDANPDPKNYPLLSATIGLDGKSLSDVGLQVRTVGAQWIAIGAGIEKQRLTAKAAIAAATTIDAALAAFNAAWSTP